MELGDYLKSINQTKVNLMRTSDDPRAVTDYPAYVVRWLLSYHRDAIFFANELCCCAPLEPQMEYEYFLHALAKRSRFAKPEKKSVVSEDVELLKRFYAYSTQRAEEVLPLHTPDDLDTIRQRLSKGGIVSKGKTTASKKKAAREK